jgi:MFS family permease
VTSPRPLPWLHRLAPGLFYGWIIALGCGVMSFTVVGVGFYGLVVFQDALVEQRGFDRALVSTATSVYWVTTGVIGTLIGRSVDRFGARGFMAGGLFLMAAGLLAVGWAKVAWQVFPAYLVLAVGFACAGAVTNGAIITRWFSVQRARAMTVSHTGVSLGGMLLVPAVTASIAARGLELTTYGMAAGILLLGLPVVAFVLRSDPGNHDLHADGAPAPTPDATQAPSRDVRIWGRREVLATATFHRLAAAYALMLFGQVAVAMHQIAIVRAHLAPELAALAVSLTAAGSFAARLVVGGFADRVDRRKLAAGLFLTQSVSIVILALGDGPVALLGASLLFGCTVGSIFMLQTLLVGELFGMASFGTAFGMQQLVSQVASGFGPAALGLAVVVAGGYPPPLLGLVATSVLAAFLVAGVRPPLPAAPPPP